MATVVLLGVMALVAAIVAGVTWHRGADERQSVQHHQHTLETLRTVADRRQQPGWPISGRRGGREGRPDTATSPPIRTRPPSPSAPRVSSIRQRRGTLQRVGAGAPGCGVGEVAPRADVIFHLDPGIGKGPERRARDRGVRRRGPQRSGPDGTGVGTRLTTHRGAAPGSRRASPPRRTSPCAPGQDRGGDDGGPRRCRRRQRAGARGLPPPVAHDVTPVPPRHRVPAVCRLSPRPPTRSRPQPPRRTAPPTVRHRRLTPSPSARRRRAGSWRQRPRRERSCGPAPSRREDPTRSPPRARWWFASVHPAMPP